MISQWWPLLAAFWAAFLFDCVKVSRRSRFLFSSASGRRARAQFERVAFSAPSPRGWHTLVEDPPYSFSPDGLCNLPVGAASRPSPEPDVVRAWRWDEIEDVSQKKGQVFVNGLPFCAVSAFGSAAALQALAATCAALPPPARSAHLARIVSSWFRPTQLRRRIASLRARTASVADLASINFCIALVATLYLSLDGAAWVGDAWAGRIGRALPWIAGYAAVMHLATLALAWRTHRQLWPQGAEERFSLVLNALMLPPQGLRLRAQLFLNAFRAQHPLAWFAAVASREALERHARQVLADLRWPLPPRQVANAALVAEVTAWMRGRIAFEADRILQLHSVSSEALLSPPPRDSATSCAYCPRCRDQFSAPDAHCPRGVKLQTLK